MVAVAVAANFAAVHAELARRFEAGSGHTVTTSPGATGQLYAQIVNGAPFDVLLAADEERPRRLEEAGMAVAGTRFSYAIGRLVLYGPGLDSVRAGGQDLLVEGAIERIAIANPRTAPYGAAAEDVLARIGGRPAVRKRVVRGESIGQAFQFVQSGAAELGFVALSQVVGRPPTSYWLVPTGLHGPIRQDAVLLARAANNAGARAYLAYLRGDEARGVIERFGYATEPPPS
jgi:molybdate transport system substrate-binding protein